MKKNCIAAITVLLVITMMLFCLTGCENSSEKATEAANSFIEAIKAGDITAAQELANDGVITKNLSIKEELDSVVSEFTKVFEENLFDMPDNMRTALDSFVAEMSSEFISDCELSELTKNDDGSFGSQVSINYGYGSNNINYDTFVSVFNDATAEYYNEHLDTYGDQVSDELIKTVYSDAAETIAAKERDMILETEGGSVNFRITVGKDEEGNWKVIDFLPEGNIEKITSLADEFLKALVEYDEDKIKELAEDDVIQNIAKIGLSDLTYNFEDTILSHFDMLRNQVSGEVTMDFLQITAYVKDYLLGSYNINDITEEDGVGKVSAAIKVREDFILNTDTIIKDIESRMEKFEKENEEAVKAYRDTEGEEATKKALVYEVIPGVLEEVKGHLESKLDTTEGVPHSYDFTVQFKDGAWKICQ